MSAVPEDFDPYGVLGVNREASLEEIAVARAGLLRALDADQTPRHMEAAVAERMRVELAFTTIGSLQAKAMFDASADHPSDPAPAPWLGDNLKRWARPPLDSPTVSVVPWDAAAPSPTFRAGGASGTPHPGTTQAEGRRPGVIWFLAIMSALLIVTGPIWVYWISRRWSGRRSDPRRRASIVLATLTLLVTETLPGVGVILWALLLVVVLRVTRDAILKSSRRGA